MQTDTTRSFLRCENCNMLMPIHTGELIEVNGQPARVCSSCFRKLTDKKESLCEVMPAYRIELDEKGITELEKRLKQIRDKKALLG